MYGRRCEAISVKPSVDERAPPRPRPRRRRAAVLDDKRLAEFLAKLLRRHSCHGSPRSAGTVHDNADRLVGIIGGNVWAAVATQQRRRTQVQAASDSSHSDLRKLTLLSKSHAHNGAPRSLSRSRRSGPARLAEMLSSGVPANRKHGALVCVAKLGGHLPFDRFWVGTKRLVHLVMDEPSLRVLDSVTDGCAITASATVAG